MAQKDSQQFKDKKFNKDIVPPSEKCKFCGKELRYYKITNPYNGKFYKWSDLPKRCTCKEATAFWKKKKEREEQEKQLELERKQKAKEQEKINKIIATSGINAKYQSRTFDNFETDTNNKAIYDYCKDFADTFGESKEKNSILFMGNYGTGKTHLAVAIANTIMQKGNTAICATMIELLDAIKQTYADKGLSEQDVLKTYINADLLIIDDLGSEAVTDWAMSKLYYIVNSRYENYKPIIITTNYNINGLIKRLTPNDGDKKNAEKTVDRLKEICYFAIMDYPSYRGRKK